MGEKGGVGFLFIDLSGMESAVTSHLHMKGQQAEWTCCFLPVGKSLQTVMFCLACFILLCQLASGHISYRHFFMIRRLTFQECALRSPSQSVDYHQMERQPG